MKKLFLSLCLALCSIFALACEDSFVALQKILASEQRSKAHKASDQYRHPLETLQFFEVKQDMAVLEVWPDNEAWYTEILAPYLKEHGSLTVANFALDSQDDETLANAQQFTAKLASNSEYYERVMLSTLQPPEQLELAAEASMDRILSFCNVHRWMREDQALAVFKAMYKALKPGGLLGIVEHRNSMHIPPDPLATSGYVHEDQVVALAMKAGFEFLAKSEINANPKDTKNYPEGVWALPPSLRLGEAQRDKYMAIGESDRMTLKFMKLK